MASAAHILILDNSPRRLGGRWFTKGLRSQPGCEVDVRYVLGGQRVVSLAPYDGVIIGGSPASATDDEPWIDHEVGLIREAKQLGMPLLGVCFGSQLLAHTLYGDGAVRPTDRPEFGWHYVECTAADPLFEDVPQFFSTFQYHTEEVAVQPGMRVLARNDNSAAQAYRVGDSLLWGLQFHFEVTPQAGRDLLRRTRHVYDRFGLSYSDVSQTADENEAAQPLFRNFVRIAERYRAEGGPIR